MMSAMTIAIALFIRESNNLLHLPSYISQGFSAKNKHSSNLAVRQD